MSGNVILRSASTFGRDQLGRFVPHGGPPQRPVIVVYGPGRRGPVSSPGGTRPWRGSREPSVVRSSD